MSLSGFLVQLIWDSAGFVNCVAPPLDIFRAGSEIVVRLLQFFRKKQVQFFLNARIIGVITQIVELIRICPVIE